MKIIKKQWLVIFISSTLLLSYSFAQQKATQQDKYIWTEEQRAKLQIIVHIWGEVKQPGQYVVPDGTNVLELISLAGGPNEYSNLSKVKLTRIYFPLDGEFSGNEGLNNTNLIQENEKEIYTINLKRHLKHKEHENIYTLKPGDVVKINRNFWYSFQIFIQTVYQIAIIAQGLYFYTQIFKSE